MAEQSGDGVEQRVLEIFDKVASSISPVDKLALGIVSLGGAVGGFLLPVMQSSGLVESRLSVGFALAPLLGIAAAGISVFVLANCRLDDKLRLLFFSLLCGLTFPTVLASAMNAQSQAGIKAEKAADAITATAGKLDNKQASEAIVKALEANQADALSDDPDAAEKLETAAKAVVDRLASAASNPADPEANIANLSKIGEAAKASGHDATVVAVASALQTLETSGPTKEAAQVASQDLLITGDAKAPQNTKSPEAK
jgi:hypothetical protein